jgi:hypothetical protein
LANIGNPEQEIGKTENGRTPTKALGGMRPWPDEVDQLNLPLM